MADTNVAQTNGPQDEINDKSLTECNDNEKCNKNIIDNTQQNEDNKEENYGESNKVVADIANIDSEVDQQNVEKSIENNTIKCVMESSNAENLDNRENNNAEEILSNKEESHPKSNIVVDNDINVNSEIGQQNVNDDGDVVMICDEVSSDAKNLSNNTNELSTTANLNDEMKPTIEKETTSISEQPNTSSIINNENEKLKENLDMLVTENNSEMDKDTKPIDETLSSINIDKSSDSISCKDNVESVSEKQTNDISANKKNIVDQTVAIKKKRQRIRNVIKDVKTGESYIGQVKWEVTSDEVYKMTEEELQTYYRRKRLEMELSKEERTLLEQKMKVGDKEEYVWSIYPVSNKTWLYLCHVCGMNRLDSTALFSHANSKKHKRLFSAAKTPSEQFAVKIVEGTFLNCGVIEQSPKTFLEKNIATCYKPFIGIEYIVEYLKICEGKIASYQYYCLLCDVHMNPSGIISHLQLDKHRKLYLAKYFPILLKAMRRIDSHGTYAKIMAHVIGRIQYVHGRLHPLQVQRIGPFEPWKKSVLHIIDTGEHIRENRNSLFTNCVTPQHVFSNTCQDNWKKRLAVKEISSPISTYRRPTQSYYSPARQLLDQMGTYMGLTNTSKSTPRPEKTQTFFSSNVNIARTIQNTNFDRGQKRKFPFSRQEELSPSKSFYNSPRINDTNSYRYGKQQRLNRTGSDNFYPRNTAATDTDRSARNFSRHTSFADSSPNKWSSRMETEPFYSRLEKVNQRNEMNHSLHEKYTNLHSTSLTSVKPLSENEELIAALRKILVLEDYLGLLGQKVLDLLSECLKSEKFPTGSKVSLLSDFNNCILLETVKEKLIGLKETGIIDGRFVDLNEMVIKKITVLLSPKNNKQTHSNDSRVNSWKEKREMSFRPSIGSTFPDKFHENTPRRNWL